MKHLLVVIWAMVALVVVVAGCGGTHRYDSRLVAADSMMADNPDSALAVIEAIAPDSLANEGDRAYRDLLLTQARYKCYITATSDSDINRALEYYCSHSNEREKLTRAYIYKGAVMDELGSLDSAMFFYKTAEAIADSDDYFNLGYVKMRIASLYQDQLSQDSAAIVRLKDAIYYFKLLNDTNYLISCYGDLGALCGVRHPDSTEYYLTRAIDLAQRFNPAQQYTYKSKLAGFYYFYHQDYQRSNAMAMDVFRHGKSDCLEPQFYYYAILSFIKLRNLDSAKYILKETPAPQNAVDSMNYFNVMAEIAKAEHNSEQFGHYESLSKGITTDIMAANKERTLSIAEKDFHYQQLEKQHSASRQSNRSLALILSITLCLLLVSGYAIFFMNKRIGLYKEEKKSIKKEFDIVLTQLNNLQHQSSSETSKLVSLRLDAMKELSEDIRIRIDDSARVKRIVPLSAYIKMLNERHRILQFTPSDSFWEKMRLSVDGEYNNIVSFIEEKYPDLTSNDIHLFCLFCAKLTPQLVKICMNYVNAKTASNYKSKFIRTKLGLDMNFDDFINLYLRGEL